MQIKETIGVSYRSSVESPSLENIVVLVDSAVVRGSLAGRRSPRER